MTDQAAVRVIVTGRVQGVFFRAFTVGQAQKLGLTGYARNLRSGSVEVCGEGEKEKLEELIEHLKVGPASARVEKVTVTWLVHTGSYRDFTIVL